MNNKKSKPDAEELNYCRIKPYSIHGDNESEFVGSKLQKVMDTNKIVWTHSSPLTNQQKGKIEWW